MKKEILRISNLNYRYSTRRILENISLCILEGECIGLLGLSNSGVQIFSHFIEGNNEENEGKFHIYVEGKRLTEWEQLRSKVYKISASNYIIDDWTIAEYVGLLGGNRIPLIMGRKRMEAEVQETFEELGIPCDILKKLRDLSEVEKRIVDLVKAYKIGAKIILIEDEFEGTGLEELGYFAKVMGYIIEGRMSVIISSHSNDVMTTLSEKYIVFDKGRIVKKLKNNPEVNEQFLQILLKDFMGNVHNPKTNLEKNDIVHVHSIVYRVMNLSFLGRAQLEFEFAKGEVTTLLVMNRPKLERLFLALSGKSKDKSITYQIGENQLGDINPANFVHEKIVSIQYLGSVSEVFSKMSVSENLILPSLEKLTSREYIVWSNSIFKKVEELEGVADTKRKAKYLRVNELIRVTLERWYIFNPKVLVLFEPFALCDVEGVGIVKSYIRKFVQRDTSVIIIKTRLEYTEDISDHIVHIE